MTLPLIGQRIFVPVSSEGDGWVWTPAQFYPTHTLMVLFWRGVHYDIYVGGMVSGNVFHAEHSVRS